ncbi:receptor-interacting serine/threonine-protein kinase 3-like isoform X2 [Cyclopterus lumpus]|uniref:receptor-interacting serine/threonine-protein kinase 3-like isoform X2 n=1 Tax=Cyclopterus lumpus TaxID=8103 RepID=UPI00148719B1|nr:receptor-interacting serine/threonine-protein kinase 3-like isoform X2 [Cyclopterus lumpus]
MELLIHKTEPVVNESLEKWESVGHGGFGHVYKARHKDWGVDVAIKILRDGVCHFMPLCDEANRMHQASCEFVLRLHGIYQGCPPGGTSTQQGLVMEFMETGSVESLQKDLSGPPLWPLVCRLAHQVAVGMNFLHSRKLMHHDLKPSNVLLNVDLNAKLADFGLSRVSTSALNSNREIMRGIEGSYKYMPPEAFEVSYEPVRSFDVYSYGILLWSIITGKEPYPSAAFALVELKIPVGDRPKCEKIDQMREEGLKELVDLMKKCWDGSPSERPTFKNCLAVTENVFSKNKEGIHDAVGHVLTTLKSPTKCQSNTTLALNVPLQPPEQSESIATVDNVILTKTERSPIQDSVRISTTSTTDKGQS